MFGFERGGRISTTSLNTWRFMPGRVGLGQASSSSAPTSPSASGTLSTSKRMVSAAVCQPLAAKTAEQRSGRGGFDEIEILRIDLGRELLDLLGFERLRADCEPLPDVNVFEVERQRLG